ncbi:MAG: GNAT family N-acetyltransferase [Eubacterium sp.]|nr:GNAT family N-acetyltransferase [Eubacterium sp.]
MKTLFFGSKLIPMTEESVIEISKWEYEKPFDVYSFNGRANSYLMDKSIWGKELFCLSKENKVLGQVSCQFEGNDLWVGWSLAPELCGCGNGTAFVERCVEELKIIKNYTGKILLRVVAWNQRAIKAYQNAGFVYVETIQDEVAYSNHTEDFLVMELTN